MPQGEFDLIRHYFSSCGRPHPNTRLAVGDDAALIAPPQGYELVVAVDTVIAGVHFPAETDPDAIGHKALAVNLSDLAAMGAEPAWATLSLALPDSNQSVVDGIANGFCALAKEYGVQLIGGDTVRGPLTLTVQVMGLVPAGQALRRDGAQSGDRIFVSGSLGDAGAALQIWQGKLQAGEGVRQRLQQRLDRPTPRLALGEALRGLASSAIDISDGLLADLGHLFERNGLGADIDAALLPVSGALAEAVSDISQRRHLALTAGDDYELCFTVPPQKTARVETVANEQGIKLTEIGVVRETAGVEVTGAGELGAVRGYDHFSGESDG